MSQDVNCLMMVGVLKCTVFCKRERALGQEGETECTGTTAMLARECLEGVPCI